MLRLDKERLLKEDAVRKIQFDNDWYFDVDSVSDFIQEDLSGVGTIVLPFDKEYKRAATIEGIEKGRKQEELSEFNKALLKMKNFKDK